MKHIFILSLLLLFLLSNSKIGLSEDLFKTNEHIIEFVSNNIDLDKEKKINEIKIIGFQKILSNILTTEDLKKIKKSDISFINNFILNFKINNEKIVNNNYYSTLVISYNKQLILEHLINNKIGFVKYLPSGFLTIILDQDTIKSNLLSKDNNFYKHLIFNEKKNANNFFIIPNLDYNDRYLYDKDNFFSEIFIQNNKLNNKYKTYYQILVHSVKKENSYKIKTFLFYDNKKYLVMEIKKNKLNYNNFFNILKFNTLNKWKEHNMIDTNVINNLDCNININNISELSYVRNKLKTNIMVKNLNLKTIKLNKNIYKITFFGNINLFINSLKRDRLKLFINDNDCAISLV